MFEYSTVTVSNRDITKRKKENDIRRLKKYDNEEGVRGEKWGSERQVRKSEASHDVITAIDVLKC